MKKRYIALAMFVGFCLLILYDVIKNIQEDMGI